MEIRLAIPRIVIQIECAASIVRLIHSKVINPIGLRSERIITVVNESHGKAGAEAGDSEVPIPRSSGWSAEEARKGI